MKTDSYGAASMSSRRTKIQSRLPMAIHPIDLQTMYSQMDTVARTAANQQQGVQLSQQMQEAGKIRKLAEEAAMVHKAADDDSKAMTVKDEPETNTQQQKKKNRKDERFEEETKPKDNEIRES